MPSFNINLKYAALSEVTDGLFVGGISDLKPEKLYHLGITCIINCTSEVPNMPCGATFDFERVKLWLADDDDADLLAVLDDVVEKVAAVRAEGGKVLLHCLAGVSRSAACALACLVKLDRMSLRRAYRFLEIKRPLVRPNLGFWRQLMEYEVQLRQSSSVHLITINDADLGRQEIIPDVYLTDDAILESDEAEPAEMHQNKENLPQNSEFEGKSSENLEFRSTLIRKQNLRRKIEDKNRVLASGQINQMPAHLRRNSGGRRFTPSLESLPEAGE